MKNVGAKMCIRDRTYTLERMTAFVKQRLNEITKVNLYDIGLSEEELKKRDKLLAGYLKQIEIQEEFIQKQKEMIEYLEDYISKITDIISCLLYTSAS